MVQRLDFAVASPADFARLRERFAGLAPQPKVLATREGGIDISSPGRQSLSLLVGEESAGALYATDVYLSPGFGAPPHHQPTEEELWYLLEGELDVRIGARKAAIRAGSFAFIPRDTTHAFKNNGQAPVRLLAWNAPAGHERAFEAMRDKARQGVTGFPELRETLRVHEIVLHADEQEAAANDTAGGKVVLERAQGRDASRKGVDVRVLLDAGESGGLFEVSDVLLAHGAELPVRHGRSDTCVYVVRGTAAMKLSAERHIVAAGAFAFIPRGHPLRLANLAKQPAQLLIWTTPAAPL